MDNLDVTESSKPFEKYYIFDPRKLRTPIILAIVLIAYTIKSGDWWALLGLPLIYIGWVHCSPNLNTINGCLPILLSSILLSLGVWLSSGTLLATGLVCGAAWIITSIEAALRMRPVTRGNFPNPDDKRC